MIFIGHYSPYTGLLSAITNEYCPGYMSKQEQNKQAPSKLLLSGFNIYIQMAVYLLKLDLKNFLTGVCYDLMAKILLFVSMFFPVKIVLLLNPSQDLPNLILRFVGSKEYLVFLLCILMLVLMALASIFKKNAKRRERIKVESIYLLIPEKSDKKNIKAIKALISRCVLSSTLIIFSLICIIGTSILYPEVLAVSFVSFMAYIMLIDLIARKKLANQEKASKVAKNLFSNLGRFVFLTTFIYIVFDTTVNNAGYDFFIVVISVLLVRQYSLTCGQVAMSCIKIESVKKQAVKILGHVH